MEGKPQKEHKFKRIKMKTGWILMFSSTIIFANGIFLSILSFSINKNSKPTIKSYFEYLNQEKDVKANLGSLILFSLFLAALSLLFIWVDDRPADPYALKNYISYLSLVALGGLNLFLRLYLISQKNPTQLQKKMSGIRTARIAFSIGLWPKENHPYLKTIKISQLIFISVVFYIFNQE